MRLFLKFYQYSVQGIHRLATKGAHLHWCCRSSAVLSDKSRLEEHQQNCRLCHDLEAKDRLPHHLGLLALRHHLFHISGHHVRAHQACRGHHHGSLDCHVGDVYPVPSHFNLTAKGKKRPEANLRASFCRPPISR